MVLGQVHSGAARPTTTTGVEIAVLVAGLIAAVLVLALIIVLAKRRLARSDHAASVGLSFDDLRRMLRQGQVTQEEHDRLRQALLAEQGLAPDAPGMAKARAEAEALRRGRRRDDDRTLQSDSENKSA